MLVANIATATSTTPMQNRSERVTRSGPPGYDLASTDDLAEQSNCEGSKGSCTAGHFFRFPNTNWNVLIDVVAQSGSFKPNATSLHNDSVIESEQHY